MLDAWSAGDRQKAAAEAPWEAIEQMFIFGTPEEMKERLEAFVAGGITVPILTPVCPPDQLAGMIDALAR
jgi:alkanesulfonate monooxygenase SsuD/methylene tetrahydromethanopterin reductase-like flavin-dependent oxidoreductase (luciferase family)